MAYYIYTPRNVSDIKSFRMRIETADPLYHGKKKLKVKGLELCDLPSSIFKLYELEILDLSPERQACLNYKLMSVPKAIGRLTNLNVLILDTNELEDLPDELSLLVNLESLALSNNRLSKLPSGFRFLKKMRSLHLANNEFENFPVDICELETLEFLDMCDNRLRMLPESISNLSNMHTLLLCFNRLAAIPDSICDMTGLHCLWLGNNLLQRLPDRFGNLRNLDWDYRYTSSTLDGNPLTFPPIEICRQGPQAIEKYMKPRTVSLGQNRNGQQKEEESIRRESDPI